MCIYRGVLWAGAGLTGARRGGAACPRACFAGVEAGSPMASFISQGSKGMQSQSDFLNVFLCFQKSPYDFAISHKAIELAESLLVFFFWKTTPYPKLRDVPSCLRGEGGREWSTMCISHSSVWGRYNARYRGNGMCQCPSGLWVARWCVALY